MSTQPPLPLEVGTSTEHACRTDSGPEWRLDERTREIGRRGLAEARASLAAATRRADKREHGRPPASGAAWSGRGLTFGPTIRTWA